MANTLRAIFRRAYTVRHGRANIAIIPHPGHVAMKLRNLQTDEMQWRMAATKQVFQQPLLALAEAREIFL